MDVREFLDLVQKKHQYSDQQLERIRQAAEFAQLAHRDQKRVGGGPYVEHVLATALTLVDLDMDADTIIAGLLHDVPEDTTYTLDDIEQRFGKTVTFLVNGVTKLGTLKYRGMQRYVENLRKMFLAMAADVRVMIIKFADRKHNLLTLAALPEDKQYRIARESLEIFAPIAHRLGMGGMKGDLEDLSFPFVYPEQYRWITELVGPRYEVLVKEVEQLQIDIRQRLAASGITAVSIHGRRKHLFSLYQKLMRPEYGKDIEKITDLIAVRIVLHSVSDCYAALGIIHQYWKPVPNRFKDYIAQPKPNGYKSLHTTVFSPSGQFVEIQIRDEAMHRDAEYGVAAHWHYEESGKPNQGRAIDSRLSWVNQLTDWRQEYNDDAQYLEALKIDALQQRIFCFTPRGEVIDLPIGATPIDFAYHVHSDLGNHCSGAKINGKIAALNTELRSGDVIEIMVDKNRRGPNADWMDFARTQAARSHIRKGLREK